MARGKKGSNQLSKNVVFLILTLMFFSVIFFFLSRVGSVGLAEKANAKQICLVMDGMRGNTQVDLDLTELFLIAEKNGLSKSEVLSFYPENSTINVRAAVGKGYNFNCFRKFSYDNFLINLNTNELVINFTHSI